MNPPLGGSPEPHLIEEHKVLLSPRVCGLTNAFRNPNTWAAIAASALNPDSRFRRRTGAVTTGRCFAVAMGSGAHAPGSEREAGSPLASDEVSRVRALPITHAAILCSTPAPEQKVRVTLLMVSSSPGAFPVAHVGPSSVPHERQAKQTIGVAQRAQPSVQRCVAADRAIRVTNHS